MTGVRFRAWWIAHTRRRSGVQKALTVLFALVLTTSMAGILIGGSLAQVEQRHAQAAADAAALAAAETSGLGSSETTAAQMVGLSHGFLTAATNCSGDAIAGIVLNDPPRVGPDAGASGYVEVTAQRPVRTALPGIAGQICWMVSARAVAAIGGSDVSPCSLCSLNTTDQSHTLVLDSAALRVDGTIYVDSSNGGTIDPCAPKEWHVCGDAFDTLGTGGDLSARFIDVVGGWETHDSNIATADSPDTDGGTPCEDPNPPDQFQAANVCIHMPVIVDPLDNPANPNAMARPPIPGPGPMAGQNGCPDAAVSGVGTRSSPAALVLSSGTSVICPGTYYGGIRINGTAAVTMQAGVYYIAGGGFQVLDAASVDGSAGVMIYNSSIPDEAMATSVGDRVPDVVGRDLDAAVQTPNAGSAGPITLSSSGAVKLYGPTTGQYSGLMIFQDRTMNSTLIIGPGAGSSPACPADLQTRRLTAAQASSDGCGALGGIQGTIYAPDPTALVLFTASGLSVSQVIAGEIEVDSSSTTRFAYNPSVFAGRRAQLVG